MGATGRRSKTRDEGAGPLEGLAAAAKEEAGYGRTQTHESRVQHRGTPLESPGQSPRSRPMISFMISFDPAQIFVTRASIHARATRYSRM